MHGIDLDEILVTTGGQQVIDLVCKTLIDPGDVIVAEAPDLPGRRADLLRLRGRRRADRDGPRRHARRPARGDARPPRGRGAAPEVHLHRPHLPEPGRSDDVAAAPRAAGADRRTSASCSCSRTTPTGCCATRASRCPRCTRSTAASSSSTWGRSRRSSRPASGSAGRSAPRPVLAKMNLGKQAADLCTSSMTQHFVAAYFEHGPLAGLRAARWPRSTAGAATRCSTRSPSTCPPEAEWTHPARRAVRLGHAARLHRHDRPARPRAAGARRLRPRAGRRTSTAAAAPRCASTSRGSAEDDIREGVRRDRQGRARAGRPVRHAHRGWRLASPSDPGSGAPRCRARRRARAAGAAARAAARAREPRRGPEGRALAGAGGFAALGRAGRGRPPASRARRRRPSTSAVTWWRACATRAPTSRSSRSTVATARTGPCRRSSSSSTSPTPARASRPASAAWTRCWPSTRCATPGSPRPTSSPSTRRPSRSWAPAARCRRSRSGSSSRSS